MGEFDQIIEATVGKPQAMAQYGMPDTSQPTLRPTEPEHPVPQGGNIPQLNLAGIDGFNVASGYSRQPMPDPGKPAPAEFQLSGSPECGGYEPTNPSPATPNLAGIDGMPTPGYLQDMRPGAAMRNVGGDYITPSPYSATIAHYDLTEPGINFSIGNEFAPDPLMPDLESYNRPMGLTLHNPIGQGDLFLPDPVTGDLLNYDVPGGIDIIARHPTDADPSVPDLQQPQLTQDAHMDERPGELDDSAEATMHATPNYQVYKGTSYKDAYTDPGGMNNARRRKATLRNSGLDGTSDDTGDHEYR